MTKLDLNDSVEDIMIKMSEGNPGAISVCMMLYTKGGAIDPDALFGGLGGVLSLDSLGIYGSKIWMLFKDVCKQDLVKTSAMLRAWQLGFVPKATLLHAIDNYGAGIDTDALLAQVQERLPAFGQTEV